MQIPVGDLVFDAVDEGPRGGELVLLLHGFPQTSQSWRRVWPALADAGYRVVAPDQRGYSPGARPADVSSYALELLLGDVAGVLDALGVDRAHVVGHDWGAAVAWQFAARHPDRVRSLAAVSVPHPAALSAALRTDPDQQQRSAYIRLFRQPGEAEEALLRDDGEGVRHFFRGAGDGVDAEAALVLLRQPGVLTACLNWYRAARREDSQEMLPVTVPTLYVWSDSDMALGETAALATVEHVAGPYRFEVLPGVSHWVPEEAPAVLSGLLLEHLRALG